MAANPRVVTVDRWIAWDGVQQRLPKGQVLDVPPDSALERVIGREFLVPLPGAPQADASEPGDGRSRLAETGASNQSPEPAEAAAAPETVQEPAPQEEPVPAKRTAAKKQDDDKESAP